LFFPRIFSSSITCQKHAKCPHLKKMSCYVVMFRAAAVLTIQLIVALKFFFHLSIGLSFCKKYAVLLGTKKHGFLEKVMC